MDQVLYPVLAWAVLLFSAYSVLKFAFFALPYAKRRAALDRSYNGKAYASCRGDVIPLVSAVCLSALLLGSGGAPIAFLGGLFVGATLIQLFFHAFHVPVPPNREAPEPNSPLKRLSYAIQAAPQRAWKEMVAYSAIVIAGFVAYFR